MIPEEYSTYILIAVMMSAVGYVASQARNFNIWKMILIGFVAYPFVLTLENSEHGVWVGIIAFFAGYLLPHAHILEGFFHAISSLINSIRYWDDRRKIRTQQEELRQWEEAIRRREEDLERLRREYEEAMRSAHRSQREYEEARSEYQQRGADSDSGQSDQRREKQQKQEQKRKQQREQEQFRSDQSRQRSSGSSSRSRARSGPKSQRTTHLETLGLDPNKQYSTAEIRRWVRKLAAKYHPDRYQDKSDEEIRRRTEEMQNINQAADWLKKHPDNN